MIARTADLEVETLRAFVASARAASHCELLQRDSIRAGLAELADEIETLLPEPERSDDEMTKGA